MNIVEQSEKLYAEWGAALNVLKSIPGYGAGAFGITPGHIKAKPEYQAAYTEMKRTAHNYQQFNIKNQKELNRLRRIERDTKRGV
jgi:hypothetical protein